MFIDQLICISIYFICSDCFWYAFRYGILLTTIQGNDRLVRMPLNVWVYSEEKWRLISLYNQNLEVSSAEYRLMLRSVLLYGGECWLIKNS